MSRRQSHRAAHPLWRATAGSSTALDLAARRAAAACRTASCSAPRSRRTAGRLPTRARVWWTEPGSRHRRSVRATWHPAISRWSRRASGAPATLHAAAASRSGLSCAAPLQALFCPAAAACRHTWMPRVAKCAQRRHAPPRSRIWSWESGSRAPRPAMAARHVRLHVYRRTASPRRDATPRMWYWSGHVERRPAREPFGVSGPGARAARPAVSTA
mmetsp:Transcript_24564/g.63804  ORF Transcript_24564/g.63804 Transcript_24564/m.63804 type:complete len:215 (+) Transcript_24564:109-753(+)